MERVITDGTRNDGVVMEGGITTAGIRHDRLQIKALQRVEYEDGMTTGGSKEGRIC